MGSQPEADFVVVIAISSESIAEPGVAAVVAAVGAVAEIGIEPGLEGMGRASLSAGMLLQEEE